MNRVFNWFVMLAITGLAIWNFEIQRKAASNVSRIDKILDFMLPQLQFSGILKSPMQDAIYSMKGKAPVPCPQMLKRTAVIMTLGQSQAANESTAQLSAASNGVFNLSFFDGQCYLAKDPLIGPTGTGANFATLLGSMLVQSGTYDNVVIIPIAVGGTRVEQWTPTGEMSFRISISLDRIKRAGLAPTHVLWWQGSANSSDEDDSAYEQNLRKTLSQFVEWKPLIFVAQSTTCGAVTKNTKGIRLAQAKVAREFLAGPDTDSLGSDYRDKNNCHFNQLGLPAVAKAWHDAILRRQHIFHANSPSP